MRPVGKAALMAAAAVFATGAAQAEDGFLGLDLEGSFGEGGFETPYTPPVTNPLFNETPFITTELRPIFVYHDVPDNFVTGGGSIIVGAAQARLAITDRLGFIATTDGYADVDFKGVLPDDDGFLDIAAGLKYAVLHEPEEGRIATVGLRYTGPIGNLSTGGIDLTGVGHGYFNPFVTGAMVWGDDPWEDTAQVQMSLGAQIALSDENWSFIHASLHGDMEIYDNLFPFAELNAFLPFEGGNRVPGSQLTGADIADIGASDPVSIVTLGGGIRYRFSDNAVFGVAIEGNIADRDNSVFGYRVTTDLTLHF